MTTQNKDKQFLRAALRYAELGFRVFPLKPKGKEPLVKDWPKQATTDRNIIREWWTKYPDANIGVLTGYYEHGYFCVLDFDPRNGGGWFDTADERRLPPTCVVITGSEGRHYYYYTNEPIPTKKLKEGVDLKGAGGYVVAPVSIHPNGNPYKWMEGRALGRFQLARLPDWAFFEAVGSDEGRGLWKLQPPIPKGNRHNYIVSLAGVLWNAGLTIEQIVKIITEVAGFFESLEDYDLETELKNLARDLPDWQKKPKLLAHVIKDLPDEIKNIVIKHTNTSQDTIENNKETPNAMPQKNNSNKSKSSEGNNKKNSKNKKPSFEEIVKAVMELKWVVWNGAPYFLHDGYICDDSSLLDAICEKTGRVTKEVLQDAAKIAVKRLKPDDYSGIVLNDKLVYAVIDGMVGLWGHYKGKIYCYPVDQRGVLVWDAKDAPEGVCIKDGSRGLPVIDEETLKKPEQNLRILVEYMEMSGAKLSHDSRIAYSMLIPVMLSIGDAGFLFIGKAGAGKSTFATAFSYLEYGNEWDTPTGNTIRDHVATLAGHHKTSYFDEMDLVSKDLEALIKGKITRSRMSSRKLYSDYDIVTTEMSGSVVISTTGIKNKQKSDFWSRFFAIKFEDKDSLKGTKVLRFIKENHHKARAGIIEAFRRAYKVDVPYDKLPDIRFEDWVEWSYRFAYVFDIEEVFLRFIKYAKLESYRNTDFGFLVDFFRQEEVKEGHPYKIGDIYVAVNGMMADTASELKRLYGLLGQGTAARNNIADIAAAAGYDVRIEKQILDKQKGRRVLVLIFNKILERPEQEIQKEIEQNVEKKWKAILNKGVKSEVYDEKKDEENQLSQTPTETAAHANPPATNQNNTNDSGDDNDGDPDDDGGDDYNGGSGGGSGSGSGGDIDHWDEGYEDDEIEYEDTDPWDDVQFSAEQGQAAVSEDPPASAIIYHGEKISMDDVKRYVKLILTDFLEDPPNKKDEAIKKLTEYLDIVNQRMKDEDLQNAIQYIQSKINTIKMIALLSGRKIEIAEPYIPPSPKEVPVRAQPVPAPAPPAPPPPKPPAPSPLQNQVVPPAPPAPPPKPPPEKPLNPRLNYEHNDDFLAFMYAQMKVIRRNGGKDNDVLAYLLKLRDEVSEYLRQKGLQHALYILDATIKSLF